jgi:hypothetical protein
VARAPRVRCGLVLALAAPRRDACQEQDERRDSSPTTHERILTRASPATQALGSRWSIPGPALM